MSEPMRRVERALLDLDEVPLLGGETPQFPYQQVADALAEKFGLSRLSIQASAPQWRADGETLQGLGEPTFPLRLVCSPIDAPFGVAIAEADLKQMVKAVLAGGDGAAALSDEPLCHSFYRFIAAEVLLAAGQYGFPPGLTLHLLEEEVALEGAAVTIDLSITAEGLSATARLILPDTFTRVWRSHFTATRPARLSPEVQRELEVSLHAESGKTILSQEEWRALGAGDFVTLDHHTPGEVLLTLASEPLFRGRLLDEGIEIQPVEATMDDELDVPEEEEEAEIEEGAAAAEPEAEPEAGPEPEPEPQEPLVGPSQIPVTLTVEMGRVKMTAEQLLGLQAGNMVELPPRGTSQVDLCVGGKRVGRGELLQVGDVLGVRVLELGK